MIICQRSEIFHNFKSLVIYKTPDIMVISTKANFGSYGNIVKDNCSNGKWAS